MSPAELDAYAAVMLARGIFKATIETGTVNLTVEMSAAALAAAQADRHPAPAAPHTIPAQPPATPASEDEEDRFAFMATEG